MIITFCHGLRCEKHDGKPKIKSEGKKDLCNNFCFREVLRNYCQQLKTPKYCLEFMFAKYQVKWSKNGQKLVLANGS